MWKKLFITLSALLITCSLNGENIDLSKYEKSLYSQNGEDGLLRKLFELIPPKSKFCVEFGAYDGVLNSNTCLLRKQGWKALLLDRLFEAPEIGLHKAFITADNINELFEKYQVPTDLDLISIDIDFNDFYIWQALDRKYRPQVVLIEYNATHLPHENKVVEYRPYYCGDGTNYYGASILALYQLGRSKGYSLVYADQEGVNLFFVRDDLIDQLHLEFKDLNNVEKLYRTPKYGNGPNGGHRQDLKNRPYFSAENLLKSVK
jgi:hypothetical protein